MADNGLEQRRRALEEEYFVRYNRELKEKNMERIAVTVATVGVLIAIVSGILYFLELPILTAITMSWLIVGGLVGGAAAIGGLIIRSIWEKP